MKNAEFLRLIAGLIAASLVKDMDVSEKESQNYVINTALKLAVEIVSRPLHDIGN